MATKYTLKHTGAEIDNLLTKIETAPENIASENFVSTEIANLVDSAPETLDTLGEVATALQENENVVEALNSAIGNKANTSDVLTKTNTTAFTPTADYHPVTKKYVDEKISNNDFIIHEHTDETSYKNIATKTYTAEVALDDGFYLIYGSAGGVSGTSAAATAKFGINGTFTETFSNGTDGYSSNWMIFLLVAGGKSTAYVEDKNTSTLKILTISAKPTSISITGSSATSSKYVNYVYIRYLNIYKLK